MPGPRKFSHEIAETENQVGVTTGLVWSELGGEIIFVEATRMKGSQQLILTGSLGKVLQESARTALSFLWSHGNVFGIQPDFFKDTDIHNHFPCGAIPKDGPSSGITIALALVCDAPDTCDILGDIRSIQRMLSNLLDNAIKYTASGGSIRVLVPACTGHTLSITVTDTGIGISAADLPHIFERFYRCDRSRSQSGTGLGLSLARAIARAHGGDITVESLPGQGSTFIATLPQS